MAAFKINAIDFSLTYSRCDMPASEAKGQLSLKFHEKISYIAVAQEKHKKIREDDETVFHLHAQIQFKKRFQANERTFDLLYGGEVQHPNVQRTKNSADWNAYISKEGSLESSGEFQPLVVKHKSKKLTNHELLYGDLEEMIADEKLPLLQLKSVLQAREAFEKIRKSERPDAIDVIETIWEDLDLQVYPEDYKRKHYWIYSRDPSKGKTTFLRLVDSKYRCSFYSCAEKYQTIKPDSQFVFIDECAKGNSTKITVLNQMCDGSFQYPVKGSPAITLKNPIIIVCSNYSIEEVYSNSNKRLEARFNEIDVNELGFKQIK